MTAALTTIAALLIGLGASVWVKRADERDGGGVVSTCLQEDCANWDGDGCPCRVLDLVPVDVHACDHDWLDRPESDTRECLICGEEAAG